MNSPEHQVGISDSESENTRNTSVVVIKCDRYDARILRQSLLRSLQILGGLDALILPGHKVLVKPNLVRAISPDKAQTTNPLLVQELCKLIAESKSTACVGDNPVFGFRNIAYRKTGIMDAAQNAAAQLVCLNKMSIFHHPSGKLVRRFRLSSALTAFDRIISVSKLKSHPLMTMSAAVKNSYGLVRGKWEQKRLHFRYPDPDDFAQMLLDLNSYIKPCLHIVDGITAFEGNNPAVGRPKNIGAIVMGRDATAVDFICAKLTGLAPKRVATLRVAMKDTSWQDPYKQIDIQGDGIDDLVCTDYDFPKFVGGTVNMFPRPIRETLIRFSKSLNRRNDSD